MSLTGLGEVADLVKSVAERLWPDATQREQNLAALDTQVAAAQAAINQAEASNSSLWVSGWRPGIGWACGLAFVWLHLIQPIVIFFMTANGHAISLPQIDSAGDAILVGILGLNGSFRTMEKMGDKGHLPWQQ